MDRGGSQWVCGVGRDEARNGTTKLCEVWQGEKHENEQHFLGFYFLELLDLP